MKDLPMAKPRIRNQNMSILREKVPAKKANAYNWELLNRLLVSFVNESTR